MAGGLLLRCRLETADARCASSRHSPDSLLSLHLLGMSGMPSLPRLLSALLPESMHLQRLEFISCSVDAAALIGCTQLSQLQELSIGEGGIFALGARFGDVSACMASGTLEEALDALLQQTPLLRCLELRDASQPAAGFQQGTVPHCIAACRSLELLVLQRQGLSQLPPGDYLTGGP